MTEVKKNPTPELTDEQLTAVSGGVQKIKDTHYYFHKGDTLVMGTEKFVIEKDYLDVDPEEAIHGTTMHQELQIIVSTIYRAAELYDMWQDAGAGSTPITY